MSFHNYTMTGKFRLLYADLIAFCADVINYNLINIFVGSILNIKLLSLLQFIITK